MIEISESIVINATYPFSESQIEGIEVRYPNICPLEVDITSICPSFDIVAFVILPQSLGRSNFYFYNYSKSFIFRNLTEF